MFGKLTVIGEKLRPIILDKNLSEMTPVTELFLYMLDDAEKHFFGKRLLVIASDACSLAFETACRLAANNDVTLICEESHEHSGETKIDCGCVDVKMAGNITFIPSTSTAFCNT